MQGNKLLDLVEFLNVWPVCGLGRNVNKSDLLRKLFQLLLEPFQAQAAVPADGVVEAPVRKPSGEQGALLLAQGLCN